MTCVTDKQIQKLNEIACQIRQDLISMLVTAGSGHTSGTLDMADVFTALYFSGVLKHDPKNPNWPERDRVLLSNGHICPVLYAALARAGYFPVSELKTLRKLGTRLQGHPHRASLPGIESSSGPLAHSAGIAAGMAIAAKMDKASSQGGSASGGKYQVYCLAGDGEQDEGMTWEAAMLAGKLKLDNLTYIMDRNNIQIDGYTEDVMPLEPLREKYEAFGWRVLDVDGHNIRQIVDAIKEAKAIYEKPVIILAHTIPGKGVSSIEFDYSWHGKVPTPEQGKEFLKELKACGGKAGSKRK